MERRDERTGTFEPWVLPISEEDYSALPEGLPKICGFESKVKYQMIFLIMNDDDTITFCFPFNIKI